jgi:phenylpyruvate tautomerase
MPLIKVQTSVPQTDAALVESLLTTLSAKLAKHLGKPESYVLTAFEPNLTMTLVEPLTRCVTSKSKASAP